MAIIHLKDKSLHTYGELPKIGSKAPDFVASKVDLSTCSLENFKNTAILINVYPSIDTQICFESVRTFQQIVKSHQNIAILCISMDLPFALARVIKGENLSGITFLSDFRNREFGALYGLTIADGLLAGLLARAVLVLNAQHEIVYHELVNDVSNPPNYELAMNHLIQSS
jgi:thiol peroxidase